MKKLIKCRACGADVSKAAKFCPHCGDPNRKTSPTTWLVAGISIFVMFIYFGSMSEQKQMKLIAEQQRTKTLAEKRISKEENSPAVENWNYSLGTNDISGKKTYFASTHSLNTVDFDFPYSGAQHATLLLRTHPQFGKDVIISIERGQSLCQYDGCSVLIRFDEGSPTSYTASEPADHGTTSLFISDYSSFAGKMLKAKKVRIQAQFYQEGNRTFEFDVSGFDIKKYRPD